METVQIEKLVHGGQGLGTLPDSRKVFVWNALPGETVRARITKARKSFAEAVAEEIVQASPLRIAPREANYLATSPWQILPLAAENDYKARIVTELFTQAHVPLPPFALKSAPPEWRYRNKMEYSFWGDEAGLHLALHSRGSHRKNIVAGSELALPVVDEAARAVKAGLQTLGMRAGDLKTIIVRADQAGNAVAALFVKPQSFPDLPLPAGLQGLRVYHSNPKSPASVPTALLQEQGDFTLHDELLGRPFAYDANSFFQVNIPIFEAALAQIRAHIMPGPIVDMYAGVGSIGLSVAEGDIMLVELDAASAAMARLNAAARKENAYVVEASSENSLEYITHDKQVIFDPPRAGLHDSIVGRVLEELPPRVIYLSCNPATQARDLAKLRDAYAIHAFDAFNFFPHTPHIETLAVLQAR